MSNPKIKFGDMVDGNMSFRYTEDGSDVTIIGRWNDKTEYPSEIISKEGKINNKTKIE